VDVHSLVEFGVGGTLGLALPFIPLFALGEVFIYLRLVRQIVDNCPVNLLRRQQGEGAEAALGRCAGAEGVADRSERDALARNVMAPIALFDILFTNFFSYYADPNLSLYT
jgi:hypothetical protein